MISQAIAYNLFLAFFPALLVAVALATSRIGGKTSLLDLITDLTRFLPPGSQAIVSEFLVKRGPDTWKIAALGWTGTLLAGSQVMKLVMQGIHSIYGDKEPLGFLHRQVRGLMLLLVTIAPLLGPRYSGFLESRCGDGLCWKSENIRCCKAGGISFFRRWRLCWL